MRTKEQSKGPRKHKLMVLVISRERAKIVVAKEGGSFSFT